MHKIKERIKVLFEKNKDKIIDFIEDMYYLYPDEVERMLTELEYGCHIRDEKMYDEAVSYLENFDGTDGAHWKVETIEDKADIDFDNKEYTLLDYAYAVNMKYSDVGDLMSTDNIFKAAKRYLEDQDYMGDPSERAYHSAKKRIKYFKEKDDE